MIIIDEDGIMHDVVPKKVLEQIRDEIEQNIGDNLYKNDGIYCSLHVLDKYMMPCITPEEMQKCKEVVKKYAPRDKQMIPISVIDDIRAEIEQCLKYAEHNKKVLSDELNKERCIGSAIAFKNALQIIDNYMK